MPEAAQLFGNAARLAKQTATMHISTLFLTASSATLVASLALPLPEPDSVRITNQTPAFDSISDANTAERRDSTETFNSKCSYDCSGKKREVDRREIDIPTGLEARSAGGKMTKAKLNGRTVENKVAKRSCSSHGCVNAEEGGVDVDGTNWDNYGSAWDN